MPRFNLARIFNSGGLFNGTDRYVDIGNNNGGAALHGKTAATLSLWLKLAGTPTGANVFQVMGIHMDAAAGGFQSSINSSRQYSFGGRSTTSPLDSIQVATAPQSLNLNEWYHLVGVMDWTNKTVKVYVNGVLAASLAATFNSNTYVNSYISGSDQIGNFVANSRFLNGSLDDIRIYGSALTDAQVLALYTQSDTNVDPIGSPLMYWKFNENTGTTVGNSGSASATGTWNGTLGGAQWTTGVTFTQRTAVGSSGRFSLTRSFNSGGNFNGTNNYVDTNYTKSSGDGSVCIWFKCGAQTTDAGSILRPLIIQGSFDGSGGVNPEGIAISMIRANNADHGKLAINWGSDAPLGTLTSETYTDNKWHFAVITKSGTTGTLYIDGVLKLTIVATDSVSTTTPFEIGGASAVSARKFLGVLDDARIYTVALTATQVLQLYYQSSSNNAVISSNLVGWWKFDEGTGTNVDDSGSGGNDGTWNGTLGSQWTTGVTFTQRTVAGSRTVVT